MIKKALASLGLFLGFLALSGLAQQLGGELDTPKGLRYGPLTLHPSMDLSVGYDTNPQYVNTGAKAESELRAQPMLDALLQGNGWGVNGRGWLLYDWYLGSQPVRSIADQNHYGESLDAYVVTPKETRFSVSEFYEYQDRQDSVQASSSSGNFYNGSFQDRQSFSLGTMMTMPVGEKTQVNFGLNYSDLWYASTNLYGFTTYEAQLGVARRISAETDWRVDGSCDLQHSEGSQDDSQGWRLITGLGSAATAKSSYRVEGGVMGYSYAGNQNSSFGWTYDVSGAWRLSKTVSLHVVGTSDFQPSETDANDYTEVQSFMPGVDYQISRRLTDTCNVGYRREDYKKSGGGGDERRLDNQYLFYDRLSYRLHRNVNLFVGVEYTKNASSISIDDYTRLFVNAGVNLHF